MRDRSGDRSMTRPQPVRFLALVGAALLVLLLILLIPFKSYSLFGIQINGNVWGASVAGESKAYLEGCDADNSECDGLGLFMAALGGPALAACAVFLILAGLAAREDRAKAGRWALFAAVAGLAGFLLLLLGIDAAFDQLLEPAAGFYLSFLLLALLAAAAFLPRSQMPWAPTDAATTRDDVGLRPQ